MKRKFLDYDIENELRTAIYETHINLIIGYVKSRRFGIDGVKGLNDTTNLILLLETMKRRTLQELIDFYLLRLRHYKLYENVIFRNLIKHINDDNKIILVYFYLICDIKYFIMFHDMIRDIYRLDNEYKLEFKFEDSIHIDIIDVLPRKQNYPPNIYAKISKTTKDIHKIYVKPGYKEYNHIYGFTFLTTMVIIDEDPERLINFRVIIPNNITLMGVDPNKEDIYIYVRENMELIIPERDVMIIPDKILVNSNVKSNMDILLDNKLKITNKNNKIIGSLITPKYASSITKSKYNSILEISIGDKIQRLDERMNMKIKEDVDKSLIKEEREDHLSYV